MGFVSNLKPALQSWLDRRCNGCLGDLCRRDDCFHASVQTGLVAAGGVLVDHTLLHTLIKYLNGGAVGSAEGLGIALGDCFPQRTQAAAELALVGAVDRGLGLCLTCALQR